MNLIEEAKALGFSDAAVISTDQLVFVPEYRVFCEDNLCGNYDKNPACPPQSGTVEEMKEHALKYEKTLILQTMQDGLMDYKKAKLAHNKLTEQLAEKMNVSTPYIAKIENGKQTGPVELAVEFAEFFAVSLDYLLMGKGDFAEDQKHRLRMAISLLTELEASL